MFTAKEIVQETKDRINPKTTGNLWAKVRNIAGLIAGVGGGLLLIPIIPAAAIPYIQAVTVISTTIATGAHLDKSNVLRKIDKNEGKNQTVPTK